MTRPIFTPLVLSFAFIGQAVGDDLHTGPKFAANLTGGALSVEGRDIDVWAFKAEAGVGGLYTINEDIKIRYDFVADFANAINNVDDQTWTPGAHAQDENEIYVRTARAFILTDYGSFGFQPRAPSGYWHQIYGNVDRFEYNRLHGQTRQNAIFGQSEQGNNVLSYGTPTFNGFQYIGAVLTTDAYSRRDADIISNRVIYKQGALNAGIGYTFIDTPVDSGYDFRRASIGGGYDLGKVQLGGVYEHNDDRSNITDRGFDAWGVNATINLNSAWSISLGYSENDKPNDTDNNAVTGIVRHYFNEDVYAFIEAGTYDRTDNNVAGGLSVSF